MTKRKNHGFNKVKEVYLGQSKQGKVSTQYVSNAQNTWNNLPKDYDLAKKEVKRILFLRPALSNRFGATWNPMKGDIIMNEYYYSQPNESIINIIHELAHAYYSRVKRLDSEKIKTFEQMIKPLTPINEYVKKFKTHKTWDYYTEYHSALAELIETSIRINGYHVNVLSSHEYEIALNAYNILHNRNND